MRLRTDALQGTLSAALTAGGTTITSATLADLPALSSGDDYYTGIVDPLGEANGPEIVYITAHTASATTATIVRGKEDTTGVAHSIGDKFIIGPTALDFLSIRHQNHLDYPKHTADSVDDEFDQTTLNGAWTVVDGTSGTVDITNTGTTDVYQPTENGILCQQHNSNFYMYKAYTLANSTSITLKASVAASVADTAGPDTNNTLVDLAFTDNTTSPITNNHVRMLGQMTADFGTVAIYDNGASQADTSVSFRHSHALYMRMMRDSGGEWIGAWSHDGSSWITLESGFLRTLSTSYLWVGVRGLASATGHYVPIVRLEWLREGGLDFDPF